MHAARHRSVSTRSLYAFDRIVLLSIPLHFVGLDAARHAAGVPGPSLLNLPGRKRGPKPGAKGHPNRKTWSRDRVIAELRALARAGESTRLDDLIESGRAALAHYATKLLGGLVQARSIARVPQPKHRGAKRSERWTADMVIRALRLRHRAGESLASSRVPQRLYRAGRAHFASWPSALAAAGLDAMAMRSTPRIYTKDEILTRLRKAAHAGSDLKVERLKPIVDMKAVRREFGSLANAITAAGLDRHLMRRPRGNQKWSAERVVEVLRQRARRGEYRLTPGLHRVVRAYFGGADAARSAAGFRRRGRHPRALAARHHLRAAHAARS